MSQKSGPDMWNGHPLADTLPLLSYGSLKEFFMSGFVPQTKSSIVIL